jgi:hypothetical protein
VLSVVKNHGQCDWKKFSEIKILTRRYDQCDQYAMRVGAPSCKKPCEFRAGADSELFENLQSAVRQGTEMRRLRQKKNRLGFLGLPAGLRFQCSSEV